MYWIPSEDTVYEVADIVKENARTGSIRLSSPTRRECRYMKSEVHPVDASHMRDLDNLCDMNSLHEAPLLHMIHKRFLRDKIYAFVGNVLLSINPYRDIAGLYGSAGDFVNSYVPDMDSDPIAKMMRPTESKSTTLPTPHVFTIASQALARLEHPRKDIVDAEAIHGTIINQSIIITGESGAGKTEAAKHVIHFLTEASLRTTNPLDQDGTGVAIQDLIEKANCVFESFGNAATVRNSNSSRFGKFTKLLYNNENSLSASSTETFLLEKSRLVCVGQYERNFHVFYQMIDGLRADNPRIAQSLRISTTRDFNLLGHHGSDQASSGCKHDDVEGFRNLCRAFDLLDISRQMQVTIWEILACIMHMGNIQCFGAHDSGDSHAERVYLKVSTMSLAEITDLLGVDCGEFETALTTQKVGASGLVRVLSIKDAQNNIHAVIKWMYQRLFTWLVANFNVRSMMLSPDKESESNAMSENKFIGILDIFGFEILGSNSFEQLCINYTNEQLQLQFNEVVFLAEKRMYEGEGIDHSAIQFRDNQPVIDLIALKPTGLLWILEEQSLLNRKPDDRMLLDTYNRVHRTHPAYAAQKYGGGDMFMVKHFAGDVHYNVAGFIGKNNDSLQADLLACITSTRHPLLREIFEESLPCAGSSPSKSAPKDSLPRSPPKLASKSTVSHKFRQQLGGLIRELRMTAPHYIKCIKPNEQKSPNAFDFNLVIEQLRCSGILEVVRIRQEGFPIKIAYDLFYARYRYILETLGHETNEPDGSVALGIQHHRWVQLLCTAIIQDGKYMLGSHHVFLRTEAVAVLQAKLYQVLTSRIVRIQATYRGYQVKMMYVGLQHTRKRSAIHLQRLLRGYRSRQQFTRLKGAMLYVQKILSAQSRMIWQRDWYMRRRRHIHLLQRQFRGYLARKSMRATAISVLNIQRLVHKLMSSHRAERIKKILSESRQIDAKEKITAFLRQKMRNLALHIHMRKLYAACSLGIPEVLSELLDGREHFAEVRLRLHKYRTLCHVAAEFGNIECLRILNVTLQHLCACDKHGNTVLHAACETLPSMETVKYLSDTLNKSGYVNLSSMCGHEEMCTLDHDDHDDHDDDNDDNESDDDDDDEVTYHIDAPLRSLQSQHKLPTQLSVRDCLREGLPISELSLRPVIKAGWLLKRRLHAPFFQQWDSRWVEVTDNTLSYYKRDRSNILQLSATFSLSKCSMRRAVENDLMIEICVPATNSGDVSFIQRSSKTRTLTFLTKDEAEMHEWLTPLTTLAGITGPERTESLRKHTSPIFDARQYVDLDKRLRWVNMTNSAGYTPLHLIAEIDHNSLSQRQYEEHLTVAGWLIDAGCKLNAFTRYTKKTALEIAQDRKNDALSILLQKKSAIFEKGCKRVTAIDAKGCEKSVIAGRTISRTLSSSSKSNRTLASMLDDDADVGVFPASIRPLMNPPIMLPSYSYLRVHFGKQLDSGGAFSAMPSPFQLCFPHLSIAVYNCRRQLIEGAQDVACIAHMGSNSICWGQTWCMQTPLENLEDGCIVVIRFRHVPQYRLTARERSASVRDMMSMRCGRIGNRPKHPMPLPPPSSLPTAREKQEVTWKSVPGSPTRSLNVFPSPVTSTTTISSLSQSSAMSSATSSPSKMSTTSTASLASLGAMYEGPTPSLSSSRSSFSVSSDYTTANSDATTPVISSENVFEAASMSSCCGSGSDCGSQISSGSRSQSVRSILSKISSVRRALSTRALSFNKAHNHEGRFSAEDSRDVANEDDDDDSDLLWATMALDRKTLGANSLTLQFRASDESSWRDVFFHTPPERTSWREVPSPRTRLTAASETDALVSLNIDPTLTKRFR